MKISYEKTRKKSDALTGNRTRAKSLSIFRRRSTNSTKIHFNMICHIKVLQHNLIFLYFSKYQKIVIQLPLIWTHFASLPSFPKYHQKTTQKAIK